MKVTTLLKKSFQCKESNCTVIADSEKALKTAISSIEFHRKELEQYIRDHDAFLCSLRPVSVSKGPEIVRLMADTAEKANVGPMAAVAGVLADLAVKEMILEGSEVAVVENGGEISASSNAPIDVAFSAGDWPLSRMFGFRLTRFPVGVATSSGLYSHAISFGQAEAATVFSNNAGLADAAATAVANQVRGADCNAAIQNGISKALSIEGIDGVLIAYRGKVGMAGEVPKLIKLTALGT